MRESIFVTELRNGLDALGLASWSYKIPDAPYSQIATMRFIPEKPADIISMIGGSGLLIECKQIKEWKAFGMKDLTKSQKRNLFLFNRAGGTSLVALNVRIPGQTPLYLFFEFNAFQEKERFMAAELKTLEYQKYQAGEIQLEMKFFRDPKVVWGLRDPKTFALLSRKRPSF